MITKHRRKLDKLWREKILEGQDKDVIDGSRDCLNVHHYIGRRNLATRWYLPNGIVLSSGNHIFKLQSAHQNPEWFREEMLRVKGNLWIKDLLKQSNKTFKGTYEQVLSYLNGETKNYC